jgi:hypothetical protein
MVQIIAANPTKRKPFVEQLTEGIVGGLGAAGKYYLQNQPKREYEKSLEELKKVYANPDLSSEEKLFHAYKTLGPDKAKSFTEQITNIGTERENRAAMKSFGEQLKAGFPDSPIHQTLGNLYTSGLPSQDVSNIARSLTGTDPFKQQQQTRLQLDSVLRAYSQRIKELDSEIKGLNYPNTKDKEEYADLKAKRDALRGERDRILDFRRMSGFGDFGGEDLMMEDFAETGEEDEMPKPKPKKAVKKVRFDPKNKEHMAKFNQLDRAFFGNREKINAALAKEFTL